MATHSSVLCLENPRDREAWWAALYGVAQNWTGLKRLSSSSSSLFFAFIPLTLDRSLQEVVLNKLAILLLYVKEWN